MNRNDKHFEYGRAAALHDHHYEWISKHCRATELVAAAKAQSGGPNDYWVGYYVQLRAMGYTG